MYMWFPLRSSADLAQLVDHISQEYDPKVVAKKLADGISDAVKAVLIESNYVDKDYRSTYYNFYSKMGQQYQTNCVRLHFFDETVTFDDEKLALRWPGTRLDDHYFGYMVLRPTGIATIGRTILSPDVRRGASKYIISTSHKVHLLGYKLEIHGFPSMDQHADISICAHAACWSILRHYSERYNMYREYLTHDITVMAYDFIPGGIIPSKGLRVAHAERVFQQAGTFPMHVARKQKGKKDDAFYRQLSAYLESGFPLFAAMQLRRHAVAVVGFEWRAPRYSKNSKLRYAWDEIKTLAVVDDHHLPYLSIPTNATTKGDPGKYSVQEIDSFIVALPEKIFYPADAVDRLAEALFELGEVIGLPPQDQMIIRYFITTASALRSFVRDRATEFDPQLLTTIMKLPFAQFIWVVELATKEQWKMDQVEARAIIDATASLRDATPFWLFHNRSQGLVFDRKNVGQVAASMGALTLRNMGHSGFSRMDRNLRRIQPK